MKLCLYMFAILILTLDANAFIFGRRGRRRRTPINCSWSSWKGFGRCTASCGGGQRIRTRDIRRNSNDVGKPCPGANTDIQKCNIQPCPVDCRMGPWGAYSVCSRSCGGGDQTRYRSTAVLSLFGGRKCYHKSEKRRCNTQCCPVHGRWGSWGQFGRCSKTCGLGIMTRSRSIAVSARCGGDACVGSSTDTRTCNSNCCPVSCSLGSWGAFTTCTASCGGGRTTRYRAITVSPQCGGSVCRGPLSESELCNTQCCPVDCQLGEWSEFNDCSRTCGGGLTSRSRAVLVPNSCGGDMCEGQSNETVNCNNQCCSVDCVYGNWSEFESCSASCGGGQRKRTRPIEQIAECGGMSCTGPESEIEKCNTDCCAVDCQYGEWSDFNSCSATCNGGEMTRYRHVEVSSQCGGVDCDGPMEETMNCSTQCCPVDCTWSEWAEFGDCSRTCGNGERTRTREILIPSSCGGNECADMPIDMEECSLQCCPVNCAFGEWSEFGNCSHSCGGGYMIRTRDLETLDSCGGDECDEMPFETQSCNTQPCPIDCQLTEWQEWSDCSRTCRQGTQTRIRFEIGPLDGGEPCEGQTTMERSCNEEVCCPVNCEERQWGNWGECSESCGNGQQQRSREIDEETCEGEICSGETRDCNVTCCPMDCVWATWTAFSNCSQDCEGGMTSRSRTILTAASCGGAECSENATESTDCGEGCCPENCSTSEWGEWSECPVTCGDEGEQTRRRRVTGLSSCGGVECRDTNLVDRRSCERICENGGVLNNNECFCPLGWTGLCCQIGTLEECDQEQPPVTPAE